MSFPTSLKTQTITGHFVTYPDGVGAKGSARIVLEGTMTGPTDDAFVAPFDRTFKFGDGRLEIVLPASNDPQWTSSQYRIVLTLEDKIVYRGKFQVPYDAVGPLDLTDLLNLPEPTLGESYVLLAAKGAPHGVATLDGNGRLPSSQLPAGLDGDISWTDVQDKPATFPPSAHDHAFADITGKPATYPPSAHDHAFADITGKPVTYPPSTHGHVASDITGLGAKVVVLGPSDPIPGGTPSGSVIVRTAS